jgi:hypothetical protein
VADPARLGMKKRYNRAILIAVKGNFHAGTFSGLM